MSGTQHWARVVIADPDGRLLISADLSGPGSPDLLAVDAVARLALSARQARATIRVTEVAEGLEALLDLAGLSLEVEREPEAREEPLGVEHREEEVHRGDPPV